MLTFPDQTAAVFFVVKNLIQSAYQNAKGKGWWDQNPPRSFPEQIALMHSELSEALEEFRTHGLNPDNYLYFNDANKPEGIAAELADTIIRVFDTCGRYGIPLDKALILKMTYNSTRPYRHGGKTA